MPSRILGCTVKAGRYQGRVGFYVWPAESSRELMVLGCRYLAGRSGLGSLPCSVARFSQPVKLAAGGAAVVSRLHGQLSGSSGFSGLWRS